MTDDLRRLAEAATPGPWEWSWDDGPNGVPTLRGTTDGDDHVITGHQCGACRSRGHYCLGGNPENRAYIAALSPSTVLPLLDVVEAARRYVDAVLDSWAADYPDNSPELLRWAADEHRLFTALAAALERLDR